MDGVAIFALVSWKLVHTLWQAAVSADIQVLVLVLQSDPAAVKIASASQANVQQTRESFFVVDC